MLEVEPDLERIVWESIDPDVRTKLLQDAHDVGAALNAKLREAQKKSVSEMAKNGLNIVKVADPKDLDAWKKAAEASYPIISASAPDTFNAVKKTVETCRAANTCPDPDAAK